MNNIYFLSIYDPKLTNDIVFKAPPLRFSKEAGFSGCLLPPISHISANYESFQAQELKRDYFLDQSIDILNYVTHFPLRTLKNLKISVDSSNYLIYSVNTQHLAQGWFGVSIYQASNKDLPLRTENHLSEKVFNYIAEGFNNKNLVYGGLAEVFSDYCTDRVSDVLEGMWRENSLEQVITPKNGDSFKWDLFLQDINGPPLTDIVRYDSRTGTIFTLDMKRSINLDGESRPIELIHQLNSSSIASCYNVCKDNELGELTHLSSILSSSKGYGFTFIKELDFTDRNFMKPVTKKYLLNLDVKNRQRGKNKYINTLYGDERKALNLISQELKGDKHFNQLINSLNSGKKDPELEIVLKKSINRVVNELF